MTDFGSSRIVRTYQFIVEIERKTTSTVCTKRLNSEEHDLNSRDDFVVSLRDINRHMQHEMGDINRWGSAEAYYHTRWPVKG